MSTIDALSGTVIDELADLRQSIKDIIATPVGTRVMRREYGSRIFDLIDQPGSEIGVMQMIAAAADAIERWENRVTLKSARIVPGLDGRAVMSLVCSVRSSLLTITADAVIGGWR